MLHYKHNQWQLDTHRITVTEHSVQRTLTTGDLAWWQDFCAKWSHTTIDDVQELTFTDEQLARYEQIKYLPEDFSDVYSAYVSDGTILDDTGITPTHPFNIIVLKHKEVAANTDYLLEVDFRLMMVELGMI